MAAGANPSSGVHSNACNGNNNSGKSNGGVKENANGASGVSATEYSMVGPTQAALRHNPGLSLDWTPDEQSMLEDLLAKSGYASESTVVRYAIIAQALRDKTVRDVALRCRWISKKENGKRRKDENNSRKNKDKKVSYVPLPSLDSGLGWWRNLEYVPHKAGRIGLSPAWALKSQFLNKYIEEKVTDSLRKSSQVANCSADPLYVQSMMSMDRDDGISFKAFGGAVGQLLEQNAQTLDQISANFSACKMLLEQLPSMVVTAASQAPTPPDRLDA
ncbi:hypothetical protein OROGR_002501 [Orobanche gracilis]